MGVKWLINLTCRLLVSEVDIGYRNDWCLVGSRTLAAYGRRLKAPQISSALQHTDLGRIYVYCTLDGMTFGKTHMDQQCDCRAGLKCCSAAKHTAI